MRRTSAKASDSKQAIVQAVEAPARFRGDQLSLMTSELFNEQTTQKASTWITDMEKLTNQEEELMLIIFQQGKGFIKDFIISMSRHHDEL